MQVTTYVFRNPFCKRLESRATIIRPLGARPSRATSPPVRPSESFTGTFHAALFRQLSVRTKVQSALSDLIRCYELTSGHVCVRMEIVSAPKSAPPSVLA